MEKNDKKRLVIVVLLLGVLTVPVSAAINTITPGDTVFKGEQGLDARLAMNGATQLGWWASAASISDSAPSYIVSISDPTSISITPELFKATGVWYRLDPASQANGTAFVVVDPTLEVRVEDTTVNVDVTDKWVPTDDELRFRIDTNLIPIGQRTGVTGVPITIKVQNPTGSIYSGLINSAGVETSIVDIPVTTTPYYTASIWDTGQRNEYTPGTYTIWAECNVNSMKDNYNYAGKTVSQKVTVQNQDHNPQIIGNYPTTTATQTVPVATTTAVTPTPVITTTMVTTTVPVTSAVPTVTITEPPVVTTAPTTLPTTHAPGFGGMLAGIAAIITMALWHRKD